MSVETPADVAALRRVGSVVKETLGVLRAALTPGVSTGTLDTLAAEVFERHGARSAPALEYGFPGTVLISVNDEAVHGVPGARRLQVGDLVKLDVTPELNGYVADAAITVGVPPVSPELQRLVRCGRSALRKALGATRAGAPIRRVGSVVEASAKRRGFSVIRELGGHGTGRAIHEAPEIWNFDQPRSRERFREGMVLTVEPIIAAGSGRVYMDDDGWTVKTLDRSPVVHFEHTLIVTRGKPLILTA